MVKTLEESIRCFRDALANCKRKCPPNILLSFSLHMLKTGAALSANLGTRDEVHAAFMKLAREFGLTNKRQFWIDVHQRVHFCCPQDVSNVINEAIDGVYEEMAKEGTRHGR